MVKKWLAWFGLLLILASLFMGMAWAQQWQATDGRTTDAEEMSLWRLVEGNVGITPEQALGFSLVGLLLGVMLMLPWWRDRLQQESEWWEMHDEPLDTWPPAGM